MKVIGITGPTGAGKTTALNALRELGAEVIDADEVYHRLLETDEGLKKALKAAFGEQIGDKMGRIDRKALSEAVYPGSLEELGAITHPAVLAAIGARVEKAQREGRPAVVIDAIALIESGLGEKCDAVVTVLAPLEVRVARIMALDGIDESYARRRAMAQKDDGFFRAHAHYVLENTEGDTPESFRERAKALLETLLEESGDITRTDEAHKEYYLNKG